MSQVGAGPIGTRPCEGFKPYSPDHDAVLLLSTDCSGPLSGCVQGSDAAGAGGTEVLNGLQLDPDTLHFIIVDGVERT